MPVLNYLTFAYGVLSSWGKSNATRKLRYHPDKLQLVLIRMPTKVRFTLFINLVLKKFRIFMLSFFPSRTHISLEAYSILAMDELKCLAQENSVNFKNYCLVLLNFRRNLIIQVILFRSEYCYQNLSTFWSFNLSHIFFFIRTFKSLNVFLSYLFCNKSKICLNYQSALISIINYSFLYFLLFRPWFLSDFYLNISSLIFGPMCCCPSPLWFIALTSSELFANYSRGLCTKIL